MKIKINEKEYEARVTLRAMMGLEEVTGRAFSVKTLSDVVTYMYCILIACNDNFADEISFEKFVEYLDEKPDVFQQFNDLIIDKKKVIETIAQSAHQ